jgi:ATP:corrinoid adenosyltransferase
LIQVYTGDGKGKTTCALGLAFRALGQGVKVAMVQFLKGRDTGESRAAMIRASKGKAPNTASGTIINGIPGFTPESAG